MTNRFIFFAILFFPVLSTTAQLNEKTSVIAKGASLEKLGDGFQFTEGPVPDAKGNVYFTDQPNNKIVRWDAKTGEFTTFSENAGRSNGLYFDHDGRLITCADMYNQIWAFDMQGNHEVLVENFQGKLLNGPNDLWIDPKGGIYFTDPLYKRNYWERDPEMQQDGEHVYYLSPDRQKLSRVDENLVKPNGIIGSPDGKKLYIADIGDDKIYVYQVNPDGTLSGRTLFAGMGSDGMTIDNKGNIYLTNRAGVTVFDKQGNKIANIPTGARWTANVCFGGTKRDILFITAMDAVYGIKMRVRGVK